MLWHKEVDKSVIPVASLKGPYISVLSTRLFKVASPNIKEHYFRRVWMRGPLKVNKSDYLSPIKSNKQVFDTDYSEQAPLYRCG